MLLGEAVGNLVTDKGGVYVDGTLGLGGHSEEILKNLTAKGRLIGIDQDNENLDFAKERLKDYGEKFEGVYANFEEIPKVLKNKKIKKINGLLLDLGLSSPHVDDGARGFSFKEEGPLDMRFDKANDFTAADLVNTYSQQEIYEILKNYGEEPKAWWISKAIVERRKLVKFESTEDLRKLICEVYRKEKINGKKSVATQTFQALRIAVNRELEVLENVLKALPDILEKGGRFVCITYHSLEDRIVKNYLRDFSKDQYTEDLIQELICKASFKLVTKKPICPSDKEMYDNPRSRSAKMRVAERI